MAKTATDAERITGLRQVIRAANGDWHEATALWSVGDDLDWLLARADTGAEERLRAALESGSRHDTRGRNGCSPGTWDECVVHRRTTPTTKAGRHFYESEAVEPFAEALVRAALLEAWNDGHRAGIGCGHDLAVCRHDDAAITAEVDDLASWNKPVRRALSGGSVDEERESE